GGVGGAEVQYRRLLVDAVPVAEGRVHAVVIFRRDQLQRKLRAQAGIAVTRFDGRDVFQSGEIQVAFAIGRAEVALGERQKGLVDRGQRLAELRHIKEARLAAESFLLQVGAFQAGEIELVGLRHGKL